MSRIFQFYLLAMLCVAVQSCSNDSFDEPIALDKDFREELLLDEESQAVANEVNQLILDKICLSSRTNENVKSYPDYYGGSYIERNGYLTILISGDSIFGVSQIVKVTSNPIVKFRKCDFSYQELLNVLNNVTKSLENASNLVGENVTAAGINDRDNTVEVFMADISEYNISEFRKIYDHPSITFHKMRGIEYEASTSVSPAYKLCLTSASTDKDFGSFGFRARDKSNSKIVGFVTAGHVIEADDYCFYNQKTFGRCTKSYPNGAKADAAFVVPDNSNITYDLTNNINGDTLAELSTKTSLPGAGTYVNMWGAESGHQGGYVKNTTYIIYKDKKPLISDLVTADYKSAGGDSGGIIYTYVSSSKTRFTVGIHLGRATDSNLAVYSKADNVMNLLGVERY